MNTPNSPKSHLPIFEEPVLKFHQHWFAIIPILLWIALTSAVLYIRILSQGDTKFIRIFLDTIVAACFIGGVLNRFRKKYWAHGCITTGDRIRIFRGLLSKEEPVIDIKDITAVHVSDSFWGNLFGYGKLCLSENGRFYELPYISHAEEVRRKIIAVLKGYIVTDQSNIEKICEDNYKTDEAFNRGIGSPRLGDEIVILEAKSDLPHQTLVSFIFFCVVFALFEYVEHTNDTTPWWQVLLFLGLLGATGVLIAAIWKWITTSQHYVLTTLRVICSSNDGELASSGGIFVKDITSAHAINNSVNVYANGTTFKLTNIRNSKEFANAILAEVAKHKQQAS